MYDFEIPRIVEIIKKNNYSSIGLQLPEGLMDYSAGIANSIRKEVHVDVYISSNPCFGACDLADREMETIGAQVLFHFGHAPLLSVTAIPAEYIEIHLDIDPIPLVSENLDKLSGRIGLITTVQHIHKLDRVKEFLEDRAYQVHVGEELGRIKYPGQVLGCSFASAKKISDNVDCFLFIGSGDFHPLGVALSTGKRVIAADILVEEVREMDNFKDKILRQRSAQIAKARDARSFGIILGEKKGQMRKELAFRIRDRLLERGFEAFIISLNSISPESLIYFRHLDALVNTACPRITIEDGPRFRNPMLTPQELEILLGDRKWEDYVMDEIV